MTLSPPMSDLHRRARRHVPGAPLPRLDAAGVRHLVRRTTWGATPELLAEVGRDPQAWLDAQLEPGAIDDGACEAHLQRFRTLGWSMNRVRTTTPFFNWDTMVELSHATLVRYAWSRRQLLEVVCDFWSNHLNITCPSEKVWDNRHDFDTAVIRRHALGSFAEMLAASAKHPAMLRYLDNASSYHAAPNENYARELLELHTVGPDAGYGEEGVRAVARVLTGATSDWTSGEYVFHAPSHDTGAARVLGWSTPAHSAAEGEAAQEDLIRYLALHPATARNIARKLCVRFVSDDPPASLVDALAETYTATGSEITPLLRQLLASEEFWASQGRKTRRPLEGLVAAVRSLGSTPGPDGLGGIDGLYAMTRELGQAPLGWEPPNGHPDVAAAWSSAGTAMRRWNATIALTTGARPKGLRHPSPADLLPTPLPGTCGALVDAVVERHLGRRPTAAERATLVSLAGRPADARVDGVGWAASVVPALVHTVLNSPAHMER